MSFNVCSAHAHIRKYTEPVNVAKLLRFDQIFCVAHSKSASRGERDFASCLRFAHTHKATICLKLNKSIWRQRNGNIACAPKTRILENRVLPTFRQHCTNTYVYVWMLKGIMISVCLCGENGTHT